jgi:hypothetical protein
MNVSKPRKYKVQRKERNKKRILHHFAQPHETTTRVKNYPWVSKNHITTCPHPHSHSSNFPIPTAFNTHSTAALRSQKYILMNVRIMSSALTAELLLHTLPCRSQGVTRQLTSGYRCLRAGSRERGADTRRWFNKEVCARCRIPETMLISAMKEGCED